MGYIVCCYASGLPTATTRHRELLFAKTNALATAMELQRVNPLWQFRITVGDEGTGDQYMELCNQQPRFGG